MSGTAHIPQKRMQRSSGRRPPAAPKSNGSSTNSQAPSFHRRVKSADVPVESSFQPHPPETDSKRQGKEKRSQSAGSFEIGSTESKQNHVVVGASKPSASHAWKDSPEKRPWSSVEPSHEESTISAPELGPVGSADTAQNVRNDDMFKAPAPSTAADRLGSSVLAASSDATLLLQEADAYFRTASWYEATAVYTRAAELLIAAYGPNSPMLLPCLRSLAVSCSNSGEISNALTAEVSLLRVVDISRGLPESNHKQSEILSANQELVSFYATWTGPVVKALINQNEHDFAASMALRALDSLEDAVGSQHSLHLFLLPDALLVAFECLRSGFRKQACSLLLRLARSSIGGLIAAITTESGSQVPLSSLLAGLQSLISLSVLLRQPEVLSDILTWISQEIEVDAVIFASAALKISWSLLGEKHPMTVMANVALCSAEGSGTARHSDTLSGVTCVQCVHQSNKSKIAKLEDSDCMVSFKFRPNMSDGQQAIGNIGEESSGPTDLISEIMCVKPVDFNTVVENAQQGLPDTEVKKGKAAGFYDQLVQSLHRGQEAGAASWTKSATALTGSESMAYSSANMPALSFTDVRQPRKAGGKDNDLETHDIIGENAPRLWRKYRFSRLALPSPRSKVQSGRTMINARQATGNESSQQAMRSESLDPSSSQKFEVEVHPQVSSTQEAKDSIGSMIDTLYKAMTRVGVLLVKGARPEQVSTVLSGLQVCPLCCGVVEEGVLGWLKHCSQSCEMALVKCEVCRSDMLSKHSKKHVCPGCPLCHLVVSGMTVQEHQETICPRVRINCTACGKPLYREELSYHECECCHLCGDIFPYEIGLEKHIDEDCPMKLMECDRCARAMPRKELNTHVCPRCQLCGVVIYNNETQESHFQSDCVEYEIPCPDCGHFVPRGLMHIHECYHCEECNGIVKVGVDQLPDLDWHKAEECPEALIACPRCKGIVKRKDFSQHICTRCLLCGEIVPQEEMDFHVAEECLAGDMECELCGKRVIRKDLDMHVCQRCPECQEVVREGELSVHQQMSCSAQRSFECHLCGNSHTVRPSKERTFDFLINFPPCLDDTVRCCVCNAATQRSNLFSHGCCSKECFFFLNDYPIRDKSHPPGQPFDLHVEQSSADRVLLSWRSPFNRGGADIVHYIVRAKLKDSNNFFIVAEFSSSSLEVDARGLLMYTVGNLRANSHYGFCIQAINAAGVGPMSDICFAQTSRKRQKQLPMFHTFVWTCFASVCCSVFLIILGAVGLDELADNHDTVLLPSSPSAFTMAFILFFTTGVVTVLLGIGGHRALSYLAAGRIKMEENSSQKKLAAHPPQSRRRQSVISQDTSTARSRQPPVDLKNARRRAAMISMQSAGNILQTLRQFVSRRVASASILHIPIIHGQFTMPFFRSRPGQYITLQNSDSIPYQLVQLKELEHNPITAKLMAGPREAALLKQVLSQRGQESVLQSGIMIKTPIPEWFRDIEHFNNLPDDVKHLVVKATNIVINRSSSCVIRCAALAADRYSTQMSVAANLCSLEVISTCKSAIHPTFLGAQYFDSRDVQRLLVYMASNIAYSLVDSVFGGIEQRVITRLLTLVRLGRSPVQNLRVVLMEAVKSGIEESVDARQEMIRSLQDPNRLAAFLLYRRHGQGAPSLLDDAYIESVLSVMDVGGIVQNALQDVSFLSEGIDDLVSAHNIIMESDARELLTAWEKLPYELTQGISFKAALFSSAGKAADDICKSVSRLRISQSMVSAQSNRLEKILVDESRKAIQQMAENLSAQTASIFEVLFSKEAKVELSSSFVSVVENFDTMMKNIGGLFNRSGSYGGSKLAKLRSEMQMAYAVKRLSGGKAETFITPGVRESIASLLGAVKSDLVDAARSLFLRVNEGIRVHSDLAPADLDHLIKSRMKSSFGKHVEVMMQSISTNLKSHLLGFSSVIAETVRKDPFMLFDDLRQNAILRARDEFATCLVNRVAEPGENLVDIEIKWVARSNIPAGGSIDIQMRQGQYIYLLLPNPKGELSTNSAGSSLLTSALDESLPAQANDPFICPVPQRELCIAFISENQVLVSSMSVSGLFSGDIFIRQLQTLSAMIAVIVTLDLRDKLFGATHQLLMSSNFHYDALNSSDPHWLWSTILSITLMTCILLSLLAPLRRMLRYTDTYRESRGGLSSKITNHTVRIIRRVSQLLGRPSLGVRVERNKFMAADVVSSLSSQISEQLYGTIFPSVNQFSNFIFKDCSESLKLANVHAKKLMLHEFKSILTFTASKIDLLCRDACLTVMESVKKAFKEKVSTAASSLSPEFDNIATKVVETTFASVASSADGLRAKYCDLLEDVISCNISTRLVALSKLGIVKLSTKQCTLISKELAASISARIPSDSEFAPSLMKLALSESLHPLSDMIKNDIISVVAPQLDDGLRANSFLPGIVKLLLSDQKHIILPSVQQIRGQINQIVADQIAEFEKRLFAPQSTQTNTNMINQANSKFASSEPDPNGGFTGQKRANSGNALRRKFSVSEIDLIAHRQKSRKSFINIISARESSALKVLEQRPDVLDPSNEDNQRVCKLMQEQMYGTINKSIIRAINDLTRFMSDQFEQIWILQKTGNADGIKRLCDTFLSKANELWAPTMDSIQDHICNRFSEALLIQLKNLSLEMDISPRVHQLAKDIEHTMNSSVSTIVSKSVMEKITNYWNSALGSVLVSKLENVSDQAKKRLSLKIHEIIRDLHLKIKKSTSVFVEAATVANPVSSPDNIYICPSFPQFFKLNEKTLKPSMTRVGVAAVLKDAAFGKLLSQDKHLLSIIDSIVSLSVHEFVGDSVTSKHCYERLVYLIHEWKVHNGKSTVQIPEQNESADGRRGSMPDLAKLKPKPKSLSPIEQKELKKKPLPAATSSLEFQVNEEILLDTERERFMISRLGPRLGTQQAKAEELFSEIVQSLHSGVQQSKEHMSEELEALNHILDSPLFKFKDFANQSSKQLQGALSSVQSGAMSETSETIAKSSIAITDTIKSKLSFAIVGRMYSLHKETVTYFSDAMSHLHPQFVEMTAVPLTTYVDHSSSLQFWDYFIWAVVFSQIGIVKVCTSIYVSEFSGSMSNGGASIVLATFLLMLVGIGLPMAITLRCKFSDSSERTINSSSSRKWLNIIVPDVRSGQVSFLLFIMLRRSVFGFLIPLMWRPLAKVAVLVVMQLVLLLFIAMAAPYSRLSTNIVEMTVCLGEMLLLSILLIPASGIDHTAVFVVIWVVLVLLLVFRLSNSWGAVSEMFFSKSSTNPFISKFTTEHAAAVCACAISIGITMPMLSLAICLTIHVMNGAEIGNSLGDNIFVLILGWVLCGLCIGNTFISCRGWYNETRSLAAKKSMSPRTNKLQDSCFVQSMRRKTFFKSISMADVLLDDAPDFFSERSMQFGSLPYRFSMWDGAKAVTSRFSIGQLALGAVGRVSEEVEGDVGISETRTSSGALLLKNEEDADMCEPDEPLRRSKSINSISPRSSASQSEKWTAKKNDLSAANSSEPLRAEPTLDELEAVSPKDQVAPPTSKLLEEEPTPPDISEAQPSLPAKEQGSESHKLSTPVESIVMDNPPSPVRIPVRASFASMSNLGGSTKRLSPASAVGASARARSKTKRSSISIAEAMSPNYNLLDQPTETQPNQTPNPSHLSDVNHISNSSTSQVNRDSAQAITPKSSSAKPEQNEALMALVGSWRPRVQKKRPKATKPAVPSDTEQNLSLPTTHNTSAESADQHNLQSVGQSQLVGNDEGSSAHEDHRGPRLTLSTVDQLRDIEENSRNSVESSYISRSDPSGKNDTEQSQTELSVNENRRETNTPTIEQSLLVPDGSDQTAHIQANNQQTLDELPAHNPDLNEISGSDEEPVVPIPSSTPSLASASIGDSLFKWGFLNNVTPVASASVGRSEHFFEAIMMVLIVPTQLPRVNPPGKHFRTNFVFMYNNSRFWRGLKPYSRDANGQAVTLGVEEFAMQSPDSDDIKSMCIKAAEDVESEEEPFEEFVAHSGETDSNTEIKARVDTSESITDKRAKEAARKAALEAQHAAAEIKQKAASHGRPSKSKRVIDNERFEASENVRKQAISHSCSLAQTIILGSAVDVMSKLDSLTIMLKDQPSGDGSGWEVRVFSLHVDSGTLPEEAWEETDYLNKKVWKLNQVSSCKLGDINTKRLNQPQSVKLLTELVVQRGHLIGIWNPSGRLGLSPKRRFEVGRIMPAVGMDWQRSLLWASGANGEGELSSQRAAAHAHEWQAVFHCNPSLQPKVKKSVQLAWAGNAVIYLRFQLTTVEAVESMHVRSSKLFTTVTKRRLSGELQDFVEHKRPLFGGSFVLTYIPPELEFARFAWRGSVRTGDNVSNQNSVIDRMQFRLTQDNCKVVVVVGGRSVDNGHVPAWLQSSNFKEITCEIGLARQDNGSQTDGGPGEVPLRSFELVHSQAPPSDIVFGPSRSSAT